MKSSFQFFWENIEIFSRNKLLKNSYKGKIWKTQIRSWTNALHITRWRI